MPFMLYHVLFPRIPCLICRSPKGLPTTLQVCHAPACSFVFPTSQSPPFHVYKLMKRKEKKRKVVWKPIVTCEEEVEKKKRKREKERSQCFSLLGIERSLGRSVVHLDTTTLLLVAVGHGKSPAALALGGREPETEEVTAGSRRGEVCHKVTS